MSVETPLKVELKNGELVIHIGINILKFAAENMDSCNIYDEKSKEWKQLWKINNRVYFARDVIYALSEEREDGSSKLTDLIDEACLKAIEDGSEGIEDCE